MSHVRRCLLALAVLHGRLLAQGLGPMGGEAERLARWQELLGDRPPGVWTLRGLATDGTTWYPSGAAVLPVSAVATLNSAFPFGENDGPVWAGRGVTVSATGGAAWRAGPLTLVLSPLAFISQNSDFALMPNRTTGDTVFADPRFPKNIDRPQRFGRAAYGRFDLGESALRLEVAGLALGATTGNEVWGPAAHFPLVLGNNAAGVPRAWFGTARARDLWLFRLSARVWWGREDQSPYFFGATSDSRRFASALVLVLQPRWLTGLEVGAGRFIHQRWPSGGLSLRELGKPFEGILKKSLTSPSDITGNNPDNQVASAFARWAFPGTGFEVYGEFGREDHAWQLVDLAMEPEHSSAYMLGFAKVWRTVDGRLLGLRGEVLNAQKGLLNLTHAQGAWYIHSLTPEGHTERGQVLGSDAAFGGAGAWVALDRYDARGRWTLSWTRELRMPQGTFVKTGVQNPHADDVWHALTFERLWRSPRMDVTGSVTAVYELNRYFGGDAFNLNVQVGATVPLGRFDPRLSPR